MRIIRWLLIVLYSLFFGGLILSFVIEQIAIDAEGNRIRLERLKP